MKKGEKGKLRSPWKSLAAEIKEDIRKGRVSRYRKVPQFAQGEE